MLNPDFRDMLSIFNEAYPDRLIAEVDGVRVPLISLQDLLKNKNAAGRPQDLADAAWLESQP